MNREYRKIVRHYENCLEQYGDNHLGVDWPNEQDTLLRYKVMLEIMAKDRQYSLLDFGCGTALLFDFILRNSIENIRYSGLDLSDAYIKICRHKFPDTKFLCADILETPDILQNYDYMILNGVFTEKQELSFDTMFGYFKKLISVLYRKTNIGLAFNVMTKHVDWERQDLFHLPFDQLASYLKKDVTRNFIIRNDYGLYEYTVYLFKEKNQWQK